MDPVMVVLRLLHIGFGVLWVGAAWMLLVFVQPTAHALGPDVERSFSNYILRRRRLAQSILVATLFTVGAGLAMLAIDISRAGVENWFGDAFGLGITIGAIAAIISFLLGPTLILPLSNQIEKVTTTAENSGAALTETQTAELEYLGGRLRNVLIADSTLLLVAVIFMAISRYL